jgi:hypothetical protein
MKRKGEVSEEKSRNKITNKENSPVKRISVLRLQIEKFSIVDKNRIL